jgi:hypothetical protein
MFEYCSIWPTSYLCVRELARFPELSTKFQVKTICPRKFDEHALMTKKTVAHACFPRGRDRQNFKARDRASGGTLSARSGSRVLGSEDFLSFSPIHKIPEGRDVIRSPVLIVEVIGMFPNIQTDDWRASIIGNPFHKGRILIRGGSDG